MGSWPYSATITPAAVSASSRKATSSQSQARMARVLGNISPLRSASITSSRVRPQVSAKSSRRPGWR